MKMTKRANLKNQSLFFLKKFLSDPLKIGAVAPSSIHLGNALLQETDIAKHKVIVELGPGTGVFTKTILKHARPDVKLICVEQDKTFAEYVKASFPNVDVYHDSAANLTTCLEASQVDSVCLIISGIPFGSLSEKVQRPILNDIKTALRPDGEFLTFSYLQSQYASAGKRFLVLLKEYFSAYEKSGIVWKNVPPAFWYKAKN